MKAALDALTVRVRELALQDLAPVGLLTAHRGEQTAILGALEVLEAKSNVDIVHTFTLPFDGANAWTLRTMLHLETALRLRDEALSKHGVSPDPLPPECRHTSLAPLARMQLAIRHLARELDTVGYLVIAILPTVVNARDEFAVFIAELASTIDAARVRILLREHPDDYLLRNALDAKGVRYVQRKGGTSPRELEEQLHRDVQDESLSPLQRAQSLLQIGVLDFTHSRLDEAYARIGIAAQLFRALNAKPLLPLALHALASVQSARGAEPDSVAHLLEQTVLAARNADAWMTLSLADFDLGVHQQQAGQLEASEASFRECIAAAKAVANAPLVAKATMHLGDIASAKEQHAEARDHWAQAAELATNIGDHVIAEEANRRLGALYESAGWPHEAHAHACAAHEHERAFRCEVVRVAERLGKTSA
jgi:tetratricopeptide (TPR) repeat protein